MRVQTNDAKIPYNGKTSEAEAQPEAVKMERRVENDETRVDYRNLLPREGRRESTTIRFCKNVLLFVSIAAFSLACLVFICDLWTARSLENAEVLRPHAMVSTDRPSKFPSVDEIMKDFGMERSKGEPDDPNGKVISQTTRISIRLNPEGRQESSNFEMPPPDMGEQEILEDALKLMMGDADEKRDQDGPLFNFPFFGGPSRSVHPKLIIVKKINPTSFPKKDQDDLLNSMFGMNDPESDFKRSMFPFSIRNSMSLFSPFSIVRSETSQNEKFNAIVEQMDSSSARILNRTMDLESLVAKELEKLDDGNEANARPRDFLASALENLKKINLNMRLAREIIKAEQESQKSTAGKIQNLAERVKSYRSALIDPFSKIFEASADITNKADQDRKIPEPIFEKVISLGKELIDFGKLMYEDIKALEDQLGQDSAQTFNIPEGPVVHRRLIFFRTPSPQNKSELPKEEIPVENSKTEKVQ